MLRLVLSILLCVAWASVAIAQAGAQAHEATATPHRMTVREGKAIVSAAWKRSRATDRRPDCSHLVHEIYELAGYHYPYATSLDLFTGTANFVRVMKPQAGDLVVWPGHVGIVINPREHSFYSSAGSGLHTEFYDSPYWKGRGRARFYRYIVEAAPKLALTQKRSPQTSRERPQVARVPVVERPASAPVTVTPGRIMISGAATNEEAPGDELSPTHRPVGIPSSILMGSARHQPTQDDLADAISELNNAAGDMLRQTDFAQLGKTVIIYDELMVRRVKVKGERGSAYMRMESWVAINGGRIEKKRRHEKFRWKFARTPQGWELDAPKDRVYVPRDAAIRALAERLALLTKDPALSANLSAEIQIVRVLSALVEGK
jgi:hypothetical protein